MSDMTELLKPVFNNWILLIAIICVISGMITSIAKQIRKYGCHRSEMELKREMVERGLSVEEIERVIAARSASENQSSDC
jgi:hypothetical protein